MAGIKTKTRKKPKKYLVELTALSAVLWGIFFFFLLSWVFVLGIMVGRGFLPGTLTALSDLREQLSRLQELAGDKKTQISPPDELENAPEFEFYKTLATKKGEARKNYRLEKRGDKSKTESHPIEVDAPDKSPGVGPDKTPGVGPDKIPGVGPEKTSGAGPETWIPEDRFAVQIASFKEIDKAEKMTKQLIDQGYDAYYNEAVVHGTTYFRIKCGRFESRQEAADYALKIEREAGLKGFVSKIE